MILNSLQRGVLLNILTSYKESIDIKHQEKLQMETYLFWKEIQKQSDHYIEQEQTLEKKRLYRMEYIKQLKQRTQKEKHILESSKQSLNQQFVSLKQHCLKIKNCQRFIKQLQSKQQQLNVKYTKIKLFDQSLEAQLNLFRKQQQQINQTHNNLKYQKQELKQLLIVDRQQLNKNKQQVDLLIKQNQQIANLMISLEANLMEKEKCLDCLIKDNTKKLVQIQENKINACKLQGVVRQDDRQIKQLTILTVEIQNDIKYLQQKIITSEKLIEKGCRQKFLLEQQIIKIKNKNEWVFDKSLKKTKKLDQIQRLIKELILYKNTFLKTLDINKLNKQNVKENFNQLTQKLT